MEAIHPRPGWTASLLELRTDARGLAERAATGALLASTYGVALGARDGALSMLAHAVGVPAAVLAVCLLGLPALYIVLALFDAPLSPRQAVAAAVRGCASSGLVLAGLAPLAALYVVGSETEAGASTAGTIGLVIGGALGLRHLVASLQEALAESDSATRAMAALAQLAFVLFSALLAWRVWAALLPLCGGAS